MSDLIRSLLDLFRRRALRIPAQVFISYARADRALAEHLASALEERGFDVVWDRRLLSSQERYAARTLARTVVVVWSSRAAAYPSVEADAAAALGEKKLFLALTDGSTLPASFSGIPAVDLSMWDGAASSQALEALAQRIERRLGAG